jgi:hypothetical protein
MYNILSIGKASMFVMPFLNKASSKVGKEEQREKTQVQPRSTKTQSGSQKGERNKLCSRALTSSKKHKET